MNRRIAMHDHTRDDETMEERGTRHSAEGKTDNLKGKIKDAAGGLTGDSSLQARGKLDQAKGKAKDTLGKAERNVGGER